MSLIYCLILYEVNFWGNNANFIILNSDLSLKNSFEINTKLKYEHWRKHTTMWLVSEGFYFFSELIAHKWIHSGERPFQCYLCQKAFKSNEDLNRHKCSHTGENPFKCSFCHEAFKQSSNLVRHKLSHSGEKTFRCSFCQKAFKYSSHLATHKHSHPWENWRCSVILEWWYVTFL